MEYPLLKNKLPNAIKKVWRNTAIFALVIMIIPIASINIFRHFIAEIEFEGGWMIISVVGLIITLAILLFSIALIPYRYHFFRYEITDDDIVYQKGFFFREITYVPINRIQHVETEQGPFLRREKLMELKIHTAATIHRIAGLSVDETLNLRAQIIEKMKEASEDV